MSSWKCSHQLRKKLASAGGCGGRKIENSIQIDSASAFDTLFNSSVAQKISSCLKVDQANLFRSVFKIDSSLILRLTAISWASMSAFCDLNDNFFSADGLEKANDVMQNHSAY